MYKAADLSAISLLLIGTIIAAAAGRVMYQMALTATNNDNGFVSMFLLLVPGVTCQIQVSTNLTDWTTLTNIACTNCPLQFLDTNANNFSQRFYRAILTN